MKSVHHFDIMKVYDIASTATRQKIVTTTVYGSMHFKSAICAICKPCINVKIRHTVPSKETYSHFKDFLSVYAKAIPSGKKVTSITNPS